MNNISVLAVDLAKHKFQIHGYGPHDEQRFAKTLTRAAFEKLLREQPPCKLVMEACGSAHFWSRLALELGHQPLQLPAQFVKPFVIGNKTDRNDANAIYEASKRPNIRPVPVKSVEQQDGMLSHLTRQRLLKTRLELTNQLRGVLRERGMAFARGDAALRRGLRELRDAEPTRELSPRLLAWAGQALEEWAELEARLREVDRQLQQDYRDSPRCRQIGELPGIGVVTATAVNARVTSVECFPDSRAFSSSLGLVASEHSSGEKQRRGGIHRRGDPYLRMLLIHGGRSVVLSVLRKHRAGLALDVFEQWVLGVYQRRGYNRAAVAVANKNARIVWALLKTGEAYRKPPLAA
jgi:transposase